MAMAYVLMQSGEMNGQRIELDRAETTLGRAPDNVIQVAANAVSSHHFKILRDGGKFTIVDLDSTNGTGLNGVAIKQARLKPKDIITAGGVEMVFDGENVEVDAIYADAATGPSNTVRLAGFDPSMATPPPTFGARKDNKRVWLAMIVLFSILALAALAIFFYRLSRAH
jgi:predicted component of type VI protein secretion system